MLQLTESAATTLADTRSQIGVPDHFGLRIFRGVSDGKAAFAFDFVETPEDGDEVGEVEETRYFVAPDDFLSRLPSTHSFIVQVVHFTFSPVRGSR